MTDQFVGLRVRIDLKPPRSWTMFGLIDHITPSSELHLSSVSFTSSPQIIDHVAVPANDIADIEVLQQSSAMESLSLKPQPLPLSHTAAQTSAPSDAQKPIPPATETLSHRSATKIQDPAIVSFERIPTTGSIVTSKPEDPRNNKANQIPLVHSIPIPFNEAFPQTSFHSIYGRQLVTANAKAPTIPPLSNRLAGYSAQGAQSQDNHVPGAAASLPHSSMNGAIPKNKRAERKTAAKVHDQEEFIDLSSSPELARAPTTLQTRPNGWRQSPILKDNATEMSSSNTKSRPSRRARAAEKPLKNAGWATEDATDVQEMEDFDFGRTIFDKKAVFDQISNDDTTADEDRLVSYNRMRKLLPSENVLANNEFEESKVQSEVDTLTTKMERSFSSKSSSKHEQKRTSASGESSTSRHKKLYHRSTKAPLKQNTTNMPSPVRTNSSSAKTEIKYAPASRTTTVGASRQTAAVDSSNARNTDELAATHLHLDTALLSESVGRALSDAALGSPASDHSSARTVILLLGEKQASCRALNAAVYMLERGARVIACSAKQNAGKTQDAGYGSWSMTPYFMRFKAAGGEMQSWSEVSDFIGNPTNGADLMIDATS